MRADAYAGAAGTLVGGSGAFADVILDGKTTAEVKNAGVTLTGDALVHGKADTGVSASGQGTFHWLTGSRRCCCKPVQYL